MLTDTESEQLTALTAALHGLRDLTAMNMQDMEAMRAELVQLRRRLAAEETRRFNHVQAVWTDVAPIVAERHPWQEAFDQELARVLPPCDYAAPDAIWRGRIPRS